jgi:protein TonB
MEEKKSPDANLEKKKGAYFAVGLMMSLALILGLFELKTFDISAANLGELHLDLLEEEVIPISQQAPPPPPPPPAPTTQIQIVEDDEEIEEELVIEDMEVDEETAIEVEIYEEEEEYVEEEIFTIVEKMPEFPGGCWNKRKSICYFCCR